MSYILYIPHEIKALTVTVLMGGFEIFLRVSGYTPISLLLKEEVAGMSSNGNEPASEQNYSIQETEAAASDREMNAVEEMTANPEEDAISDMVEYINSCDAVAAQPAAEIGGVVKRHFRSGSGLGSKDMLSSDGIIGCGFDWRAHMVVLSACDTGKGKVRSGRFF